MPDLLETLRTAQFEGLQLNCLSALTNLSVLAQNHVYFDERGIEVLFSKFDAASQSTDNEKFQSLKVIVNLSCSDNTIPKLLSAKVSQVLTVSRHLPLRKDALFAPSSWMFIVCIRRPNQPADNHAVKTNAADALFCTLLWYADVFTLCFSFSRSIVPSKVDIIGSSRYRVSLAQRIATENAFSGYHNRVLNKDLPHSPFNMGF